MYAQMPPPPPPGLGFCMPMFRSFVPKCIQPWIYLSMVMCIQFSSGMYLGAMEDIQGTTGFMIEDLLMCLYANLAGMAVYFPLLFRMKLRFSNKFLLCTSAVVIGVCNLLTLHITFLPLLWVVCFIEGMAKLQGTFECMSNIQLWMTPKRDFGIFFPVLHVVLLTAIEGSGYLAAWFGYHFSWQFMHYFCVGTMCYVLLIQQTLCRPFCPMPKPLSLKGLDFTGGLLLSILMLIVSYIFVEGDYLMWMDNRTLRILLGVSLFLAGLLWHRFTHVSNPFIHPKVFTVRNGVLIWMIVIIAEILLGCEHTIEEILYAEVFDYDEMTKESLMVWSLPGIYIGLVFDLLWLSVWRFKVWKLIAIGFLCVFGYALWFYRIIDVNINIEMMRLPVMLRGCGYAILAVALMWSLEMVMHDLEHFFMSLCIFNIFHMYLAGAIGYAIYTTGFMHYLNDDLARYGSYLTLPHLDMRNFRFDEFMEPFLHSQMAVAAKQIYGWVAYAAAFMSLLFFLLDIPAIRNQMRRVYEWPAEGIEMIRRRTPLYMKSWFVKTK